MPRNGSGVYTQPFDDVDPDTTIESAVYNGFTHDVETDLNAPRPIIAGGTGATSVIAARTNLGAEAASIKVTNYDSHTWEAGSFYSDAAAASAPNASDRFAGSCEIALNAAAPHDVVLEARSLTTGLTHVRKKVAGVWGAWAPDVVIPVIIPVGTKMLFIQADAPTGWVKDTEHNDKALRVVSGTGGGSGGSAAFATVFARTATDGHALTIAEMPAHTHIVQAGTDVTSTNNFIATNAQSHGNNRPTEATGSNNAHAHNIDLRVQYVDAIICVKS